MTKTVILAALVVMAIAAALLWWRHRWQRRRASLQGLLDLCDSFEHLLDRSQQRMLELQSVVGRIPADIGAVAHASLETGLPIREAKRDLLQHRLWIQRHGEVAPAHELETARTTLDRAQTRLLKQLKALESAGAELAQATAANEEAARREPAALRRSSEQP